MERLVRRALIAVLLLAAPLQALAAEAVQHTLHAVAAPVGHTLRVEDEITLPLLTPPEGQVTFSLHPGPIPASPTPGVRVIPGGEADGLARYRVALPPGLRTFTLTYQTTYSDGDEDGFGRVAPGGVALSGNDAWYPLFDGLLVTFSLTVSIPPTWEAVNQGTLAAREAAETGTRLRWECPDPQNEIYLIAGPFTVYTRLAGAIEAQVYLRNPDAELAERYLIATAENVARYSRMIGPYPYSKFTLVENDRETGFGMPSFTLIGASVIRLPFILTTSYPHEILHNWWGNSVYPAPDEGNWTEGLTVYLADHFLRERAGKGAEYRTDMLLKYADFVRDEQDFPLSQFRVKDGEASQAVGYGKSMMLFHMLRRMLGDDRFFAALRDFYVKNRFTRAGFSDLERAFARQTTLDLHPFFRQWLDRTAAPSLAVRDARVRRTAEGYVLEATLEQTQTEPPWQLGIPLAVTLEGQTQAALSSVRMEGRRLAVALPFTARPVRLDVDPAFDLFRRLAPQEIPPSLGALFGAKQRVFVLPSRAPVALRTAFKTLAETWQEPGDRIVGDDAALPGDAAVWLLGWENRHFSEFAKSLSGETGILMTGDGMLLPEGRFERRTHALVLVKNGNTGVIGWIGAPDAETVAILARKLPHYATYGYLGFAGGDNVLKGKWPVAHSPLSVPLAAPAP